MGTENPARQAYKIAMIKPAMVADWSDDKVWKLTRGGHDPHESENVDTTGFAAERQVDARYIGQAHELVIGIPADASAGEIASGRPATSG